ncbi:hypothetical protein PPSIR1_25411 [Plesiocystis pacifica SIR-1]|uniref:Uncharacterized protein n=2 Tax=Plesiocystis pacifica TaxID=191768 RepID=A6FZ96_9BACT|nr:hypothetical protein PPSIR1_25411 [Plesiocystis pacifica SIR-1]
MLPASPEESVPELDSASSAASLSLPVSASASAPELSPQPESASGTTQAITIENACTRLIVRPPYPSHATTPSRVPTACTPSGVEYPGAMLRHAPPLVLGAGALAVALGLACSPASSSSSTPASASSPGMSQPAPGEFLALSEVRYGHYAKAPEAPAQGQRAPDFELTAHTGETQKLSDALAEGPVVLMFYRGFW